MGLARRMWLVGTAAVAVPVALTGGAAVLAARTAVGPSADAAPALRVIAWTVLVVAAFVVATASIVWGRLASRIAARLEPLARTLRGAAVQVDEAARDADAAGRLLEQHAGRHRGVYEPLAGLAVACARDTLAASRTLRTQACLLNFVGGELEGLLDDSSGPARHVIAFEPSAMQGADPEVEDFPAA